MVKSPLRLSPAPLHFGTDGWRGVIGVDVTLERVLLVASAAVRELEYRAPLDLKSRQVIIGYDRRFLAPEFAEVIASAVRGCELEPLVTTSALPTPACSWAVRKHQALGALVVTASHNPPEWLGIKIKAPWGGSVEGDFTEAVEKRLAAGGIGVPIEGVSQKFDGRKEHLDDLRKKFDISALRSGLESMGVKVIIDPMHGSAAGCIGEIFDCTNTNLFKEIRSNRDPLFGGTPPEPLEPYVAELIKEVSQCSANGQPAMGLIFDGDGDRIAAIDEKGRFCSTQLLMPLLIDHLASVNKTPGCVIKTVSGSDLMSIVSKALGLEVLELKVGFKFIAAEMLSKNVLIGGEESGGIGFGGHLPERDALFTSLLLLEAITQGGVLLGERLDDLKKIYGDSYYDRVDIRLKDLDARRRLEAFLNSKPPSFVAGQRVKEVVSIDGIKLRIDRLHWLMFRFSGTEPLLRIYCEAPTKKEVDLALNWAKELAQKV